MMGGFCVKDCSVKSMRDTSQSALYDDYNTQHSGYHRSWQKLCCVMLLIIWY